MTATSNTTPSIPSSVTLPEDLPKTAVCLHCGKRHPATAKHFFPHRASGGLHLRSRCRVCHAEYRKALAADTDRVIKTRPRVTDPVEIARAEIAAVQAANVAQVAAFIADELQLH